jgi:hypothetical protein
MVVLQSAPPAACAAAPENSGSAWQPHSTGRGRKHAKDLSFRTWLLAGAGRDRQHKLLHLLRWRDTSRAQDLQVSAKQCEAVLSRRHTATSVQHARRFFCFFVSFKLVEVVIVTCHVQALAWPRLSFADRHTTAQRYHHVQPSNSLLSDDSSYDYVKPQPTDHQPAYVQSCVAAAAAPCRYLPGEAGQYQPLLTAPYDPTTGACLE